MLQILDKIYIVPCSQEKVKFGLDNENKSIRGFKCDNNVEFNINLEKKMDTKTRNLCINYNSNQEQLCTYNNSFYFIEGKSKGCSNAEFWRQFVSFINSVNFNGNKNFYLVTHHNRLKETILTEILDKKIKKHFANCSCLKISYQNGWIFEIIYHGEPDKLEYEYFDTGIWSNATPGIVNISDNVIINELDMIVNKNTNIFLIRHGNSSHNNPLKLTSVNIKSFINRISDSPLTPLGILQIQKLKNFMIDNGFINESSSDIMNIYCASYLNRSQHSILHLIPDIEKYDKLSKLLIFFGKQTINRILKRMSQEKVVEILNNFNLQLNNINITNELSDLIDNNMSNNCLTLSRKYKINYKV